MHQKATYEVTITSKLEQLPIPDMREAIWSRIEGELDADMPTDDGGNTPPSSPNGNPMLRFALPGIAIISIILTFFLIKAHNKSTPSVYNNTTTISQPANITVPTASPPIDTHTTITDRPTPTVRTGTNVPVSVVRIPPDSALPIITAIIPSVIDTTNQQPVPLVQTPLPPPIKKDTVAVKKKRGVQGITDSDYRLVPGKDSTRRN